MMRFASLVTVAITLFVAVAAFGQTGVKVEKIPYGGWQNCIRMSNGTVDLIATTDVGPRIIRFGFTGKQSLFFENPMEMGRTGGNEWMGFGGHRFWLAPELKPRSYHPDNTPVRYEVEGSTLKLFPGVESTNGIEKELDVTLDPTSNRVELVHKLTNHNIWTVEVSPWALTVFRNTGMAILPREPYHPHPGIPDEPGQQTDQRYFAPVQTVSLWSFTKLNDPRWTFTSKYIVLRGQPRIETPQKIGVSSEQGWAAYAADGQLFVKTAEYRRGATYPDCGCNFEAFAYADIVELESLGPLARVGPNESISYREVWYLFDNVKVDSTDDSIDRNVLPKVKTIPGVQPTERNSGGK